jgi:DNA-binding HxlR family transcriptional regulator
VAKTSGAPRAGGFGEYCPFIKAVEYLGDRWSLLIVQSLALRGAQGFNALADGLPGVSRSVLARRLRTLEALGLLARLASPGRAVRAAPYRLTPAGEALVPTLRSLHRWAERWVPEDPALVQRDPAVLTWWLGQRVDPAAVPAGPVVVALAIGGPRPPPGSSRPPGPQVWLVLERGAPPSGCLEDPGLALDRYVYVEADGAALYPIARGWRAWGAALADGSVRLYGEPALVRALPGWFRPAGAGGGGLPAAVPGVKGGLPRRHRRGAQRPH